LSHFPLFLTTHLSTNIHARLFYKNFSYFFATIYNSAKDADFEARNFPSGFSIFYGGYTGSN